MAHGSMQIASDARRDLRQLLGTQVEVAIGDVECMELLLEIGDAGWQRGDVPVDVRDGVIRSQALDVEPFSWKRRGDRATQSIHVTLDGQIGALGELANDLGAMFDRREQRSSAQSRVLREKRDAQLILVDDVFSGGIADQVADEAPPGVIVIEKAPGVGVRIDRPPRRAVSRFVRTARHPHRLPALALLLRVWRTAMCVQKVVDGVVRGMLDRAVLEVAHLGFERIEFGEPLVVVGESMADRRPGRQRRPFL
jgi:hypothetical protein